MMRSDRTWRRLFKAILYEGNTLIFHFIFLKFIYCYQKKAMMMSDGIWRRLFKAFL